MGRRGKVGKGLIFGKMLKRRFRKMLFSMSVWKQGALGYNVGNSFFVWKGKFGRN